MTGNTPLVEPGALVAFELILDAACARVPEELRQHVLASFALCIEARRPQAPLPRTKPTFGVIDGGAA